MPWLDETRQVFFVHVPRTAGTALIFMNKVPEQSVKRANNSIGMRYFNYRYMCLKNDNFPTYTAENGIAMFLVVFCLLGGCKSRRWRIVFLLVAFVLLVGSTLVASAPVAMRYHLMCNLPTDAMASREMVYGLGRNGVALAHATPEQLLRLGYMDAAEWDATKTFCFVRNPYDRMVSLYKYNRFPNETFRSFVMCWRRALRQWRRYGGGDQEEHQTWRRDRVYCHVLPQTCYTHFEDGRQAVKYIIKLEEYTAWTEDDVVGQYIRNMPRLNSRASDVHWKVFYHANPDLIPIVHEMYRRDFELLQYDSM